MSCKAYFPVYVNTPVLVSRCVPCKVTKSDDDDDDDVVVRGHTALFRVEGQRMSLACRVYTCMVPVEKRGHVSNSLLSLF
jgi:hypothetical protein